MILTIVKRMDFDGFDWDYANRGKCQNHGVSLIEIEGVLLGRPIVGPDFSHSGQERRFRAIGSTAGGRSVFVVFTWRKEGQALRIRPISARYMHKKEVDAHAKEIPGIQD
jgi:uncharacterized DUF497 family protein